MACGFAIITEEWRTCISSRRSAISDSRRWDAILWATAPTLMASLQRHVLGNEARYQFASLVGCSVFGDAIVCCFRFAARPIANGTIAKTSAKANLTS